MKQNGFLVLDGLLDHSYGLDGSEIANAIIWNQELNHFIIFTLLSHLIPVFLFATKLIPGLFYWHFKSGVFPLIMGNQIPEKTCPSALVTRQRKLAIRIHSSFKGISTLTLIQGRIDLCVFKKERCIHLCHLNIAFGWLTFREDVALQICKGNCFALQRML